MYMRYEHGKDCCQKNTGKGRKDGKNCKSCEI